MKFLNTNNYCIKTTYLGLVVMFVMSIALTLLPTVQVLAVEGTNQEKIDFLRKNCQQVPDSAFDQCEQRQNDLKDDLGCSGTMFDKKETTINLDNASTKRTSWTIKQADLDACEDKVKGKEAGTTEKDNKQNAIDNGPRLMDEYDEKCNGDKAIENSERCALIIKTMKPICVTEPKSSTNKDDAEDYTKKCRESIKNGGEGKSGEENKNADGTDCDAKLSSVLSWIACPLIDMGTNFTDYAFENFIQPMLEDVPISTNPDDGSYKAWNQFRLLANLFLVGSLLVIVYSQAKGGK